MTMQPHEFEYTYIQPHANNFDYMQYASIGKHINLFTILWGLMHMLYVTVLNYVERYG